MQHDAHVTRILIVMISPTLLVLWMGAMIFGFRRWAKAFIAEFSNE